MFPSSFSYLSFSFVVHISSTLSPCSHPLILYLSLLSFLPTQSYTSLVLLRITKKHTIFCIYLFKCKCRARAQVSVFRRSRTMAAGSNILSSRARVTDGGRPRTSSKRWSWRSSFTGTSSSWRKSELLIERYIKLHLNFKTHQPHTACLYICIDIKLFTNAYDDIRIYRREKVYQE